MGNDGAVHFAQSHYKEMRRIHIFFIFVPSARRHMVETFWSDGVARRAGDALYPDHLVSPYRATPRCIKESVRLSSDGTAGFVNERALPSYINVRRS